MISFPDKCVSYTTFLDDLAARIVKMMRDTHDDPEVVSQRTAYKMFGRGNVDRWRRNNKIEPLSKRPGKVEYRTSELRYLQSKQQDYFTR